MIYSDNIFKTFYLCLTNKCNLNCEYCYIHKKDKTNQKDVMELGDMIYAIKSANPQYVIITGGEPLLYPNQIIALQRSFKVNDSCHWNTTLCSNLYYKELTKESQLLDLKAAIQSRTREELTQQQRDHFLQQQIRTIQDELGINEFSDIDKFESRAKKMKWSKEVKEQFQKELR